MTFLMLLFEHSSRSKNTIQREKMSPQVIKSEIVYRSVRATYGVPPPYGVPAPYELRTDTINSPGKLHSPGNGTELIRSSNAGLLRTTLDT